MGDLEVCARLASAWTNYFANPREDVLEACLASMEENFVFPVTDKGTISVYQKVLEAPFWHPEERRGYAYLFERAERQYRELTSLRGRKPTSSLSAWRNLAATLHKYEADISPSRDEFLAKTDSGRGFVMAALADIPGQPFARMILCCTYSCIARSDVNREYLEPKLFEAEVWWMKCHQKELEADRARALKKLGGFRVSFDKFLS